jgi:hypothetical protein
MRKMTTEEFDSYLNSFSENNVPMIHGAIRLVTSGALFLDLTSEISKYRKQSLTRKVLRYVAQTALKGTMEIDGLALSCSFHEMKDGDAVSFGDLLKWSFYSHRLKETVFVEIYHKGQEKIAYYYDSRHNLRMEVSIWYGCHFYQSTGRIDLMHYFDDVRNPLL